MRASLVEYNEQDEREGILLDGIEQGYDKGREEQRIEDEKIIAEKDANIAEKDANIAEMGAMIKDLKSRLAVYEKV